MRCPSTSCPDPTQYHHRRIRIRRRRIRRRRWRWRRRRYQPQQHPHAFSVGGAPGAPASPRPVCVLLRTDSGLFDIDLPMVNDSHRQQQHKQQQQQQQQHHLQQQWQQQQQQPPPPYRRCCRRCCFCLRHPLHSSTRNHRNHCFADPHAATAAGHVLPCTGGPRLSDHSGVIQVGG